MSFPSWHAVRVWPAIILAKFLTALTCWLVHATLLSRPLLVSGLLFFIQTRTYPRRPHQGKLRPSLPDQSSDDTQVPKLQTQTSCTHTHTQSHPPANLLLINPPPLSSNIPFCWSHCEGVCACVLWGKWCCWWYCVCEGGGVDATGPSADAWVYMKWYFTFKHQLCRTFAKRIFNVMFLSNRTETENITTT